MDGRSVSVAARVYRTLYRYNIINWVHMSCVAQYYYEHLGVHSNDFIKAPCESWTSGVWPRTFRTRDTIKDQRREYLREHLSVKNSEVLTLKMERIKYLKSYSLQCSSPQHSTCKNMSETYWKQSLWAETFFRYCFRASQNSPSCFWETTISWRISSKDWRKSNRDGSVSFVLKF